ncbi:alpha/beta-hydrolase [Sanghuangporus baumii]|uniref:Carboxylic ester hydrolase n=1 Tax=Sanghuangporus baumii TaxID=108892 RepID=A0A9Q5I1G8_SANBA|nr:alpha/beta-hydrolase [Sanghuangporus baumii]
MHSVPSFLPFACILFLQILAPSASAQSLPRLSSPLGPVINLGFAAFAGNSSSPTGELNGPVTFFGGIRYAQPPLGDLRFRAPARLRGSIVNGGNVSITDARNWGPPCIQQPAQVGIGDEDCLRINVWKPSDAKEGDKLPVLFYIHGGGFFERNPESFPLYDLVNQSNPKIVGVNFGYRLTMMGFLAGSAVQQDGDLNAGLLDQRAALEWVHRNIAKFGGDPDNITIDGESAGGASVVMHMVAFAGSKPALFKRAIAQSIGFGPTPTVEESEPAFKRVTEIVGCPSTGPPAMSCLRSASIGALVAAINGAGSTPAVQAFFAPVIDGPDGILPQLPSDLIAAGKFHAVDFVGGHCTNDGRTFVGGTPDDFKTDADIVSRVFQRFGSRLTNETIQKALALYPAPGTLGSTFVSEYDRASTITQDIVFSCMDLFIAQKLQQRGVQNVFTFRFNSPNPIELAETPFEGVMHTSDLFYLFSGITSAANAGFIFTPFNITEGALSRETIAFWNSFATSGNPSTSKESISPEWSPFASGGRMVLNQPSNLSSMMSASVMEATPQVEIERCAFWMALNTTAQTGV